MKPIRRKVEEGPEWAAEVFALGEMPKSPMATCHKRDLTQSIVLTDSLVLSSSSWKQRLEFLAGWEEKRKREGKGVFLVNVFFFPPARPLGPLLPKHSE